MATMPLNPTAPIGASPTSARRPTSIATADDEEEEETPMIVTILAFVFLIAAAVACFMQYSAHETEDAKAQAPWSDMSPM